MSSPACRVLRALSSRRIMLQNQSWGSSYAKRSICQSRTAWMSENKDIVEKPAQKVASDVKSSAASLGPDAGDLTPRINPSTFQRFVLAWANVYPKMEDVPDRVKVTQITHARDICRVKSAHWMTGVLVLLIAIQILQGQQERKARIDDYEKESEANYQEEVRQHQEKQQLQLNKSH